MLCAFACALALYSLSLSLWLASAFVVVVLSGCTAYNACANGSVRGGGPPIGTAGGRYDAGKATTFFDGCSSCDSGFKLDGIQCVAITYTCANGTPQAGKPEGNADVPICTRCNDGFVLYTINNVVSCIDGSADRDSDGTPNGSDVDLDGDGLIELRTLDDLNNVRHTLDGSGYTATAGGTKVTTGCGGNEGVTTCSGYELVRSLNFADGASYASGEVNTTWCPAHATNGCDSTTATGWEPIGDNSNQFNTTFEGNGQSVSNLYARRNARVGFFGQTSNGAVLRNIGIVDYQLYGGGGTDDIGGLVGRFNGRISASYVIGNADGGAEFDNIGGLVGNIDGTNNSIIASYATGTLNGGAGGDRIGGLVGIVGGSNNSIIASYGTGTLNGGVGSDLVGGLVGFLFSSGDNITASYATANVDGGDGTDNAGGLVGRQFTGQILESYGFGTPTGEIIRDDKHPNSAVNSATVLTEAGTTAPTPSTTNAGPQWGNNQSADWDWDFGTNTQTPALVVDFNGDGTASAAEFGGQGR